MPDNAVNRSTQELRAELQDLATWRLNHLKGDEKGEAQIFLDRLFRAFGWKGIVEAGATLEYRITKSSGPGVSFADLLWKPRVLIEMKKAKTDLSRHFRQAFDYWIRAVPNRPRYVVLCNFDEFWVYDFENQIDEPVDKVRLATLAERWEALAFLLPQPVTPRFGNDLVAVTREAADDVAQVFRSLRDNGLAAPTAQRFVLQCVMAMFAEDIGLLPRHLFTEALDDAKDGAQAFDLLGQLFHEMNSPGLTPGGRYVNTPYFNGGLFKEVHPQELTTTELDLLREAAKTQWSAVRPEIFGTLFEGSLDAAERHAQGAHFTSQADIARIVGPVIVEPWRARIAAATKIPELNALLEAMSQYRVLDPACGSGNFLYVAYREMRRLEREASDKIRDLRRSENIAGQQTFAYVAPEQFFGIDNNPFAVEIAKVTMQLGKKLAADEVHDAETILPLDNLDSNIICADALFSVWPEADAIIGNPPFMGRRKMVRELGADYAARLDERYGSKGVSDFVTYWFPRAHDAIPQGGRAGLVATKTVKQGDSRAASLDYIVDNGGMIIDAVANMPWSGDAAVTVSIVNWQKGGLAPEHRTLWIEDGIEPLNLPLITAALSPEIDLRSAEEISANDGGVYQGQTPGIVSAFKIDRTRALHLAKGAEAAYIHPVLGGEEMLHNTAVDDWIIDLPFADQDEAWAKAPTIMKWLKEAALPTRQEAAAAQTAANEIALARSQKAKVSRHHLGFLNRWWQLGYRRSNMLEVLAGLDRFIELTRVSSEQRGPVFSFVDAAFRIPDSAVVFPYADDYSFGVLQSVVHEVWFRERCSTLETRLRYTSQAVFESFPWPQGPSQAAIDAVASAARAIVDHRAAAFANGRTLGKQYDALRTPGQSTLRTLHEKLNAAVINAYGFDVETDLLTQILELNLLVGQRESTHQPVTSPGPQETNAESSTWVWPAPSLT